MNYFEHILQEQFKNKSGVGIKSIDAPSNEKAADGSFNVFLAGTIDADKGSVDWQHKLIGIIKNTKFDKSLTIYNPRRFDWPKNGSKEVERQIRWEHAHMDDADLIIMNILEDSLSPISLMEIGMYANSGKLIVFCKPKYYRYDNVRLVCEKYHIPLINSNDNNRIVKEISKWIENNNN